MMGIDNRFLDGKARYWLAIAVVAGIGSIGLSVALYTLLGLALDLRLQNVLIPQGYWYALSALIVFKFATVWLERTAANRTSSETKLLGWRRIFEQALRLGPAVLGKKRTGELVNLATEGLEWMKVLYGVYWSQFIIGLVTPLLLVLYMLTIDWMVALGLFLSIPLTPAFLMLVQKRFKSVTERYFAAEGRLSDRFLDSLQGLSTLKMFNMGTQRGRELRQENEALRQETMRLLAVNQVALFVVDWGFALGTTVVVTGLALLRANAGLLSYGSGITLILLSLIAARPLNLIGKFFFAGAIGRQVAKQAAAFLDESPSVASRVGSAAQDHSSARVDVTPNIFNPSIRFEDVIFGYTSKQPPILRDLSFAIEPGEVVALAGPSGVGKSTVLNLLMRFVAPHSGRITIGGHPIESYDPHHLRRHLALVSQSPYLFYGTIRENLRIAKQDASNAELQRAARAAHIHNFIEHLPGGYDTVLGERGLNLSGGQAQRLAIARAILKGAEIILLDEPTSQIDSESEAQVQEALQRLFKEKTVLLISHRLSTMRMADRILMLADGTLIEQGSPDSLISEDSIYSELVRQSTAPELEVKS